MSTLPLLSNYGGRFENQTTKGLPTDEENTRKLEELMSKRPEQSYDWMGPEYEKHIEGLRQRYPMLTQMLLRPGKWNTANLSDIGTTNKYARLADAYNAGYRYVGPTVQTGFGTHSITDGDPLQAVEKLETQDQKQMEELRKAQDQLREYTLDEESHYQRDLLKRKMDEMTKLTDREYQQQWRTQDEAGRRYSALFDSWLKLNEQEFTQVMEKLRIPKQQSENIMAKIIDGDYIGAAYLAQAHNITPMNIDQMYQYGVTAQIASQLASGEIPSPELLAQQIGHLKGTQVIAEYGGLFNAAKDSNVPMIENLANFAERAVNEAIEVGDIALGGAKAALVATAINFFLKEGFARVGDIMTLGVGSKLPLPKGP
jgi:hypothetical protein